MKGIRVATLAAVLALAAPLSADPVTPRSTQAGALSPPAREAAAVVDAFHAALHRGDTQAAAALVADDALIFESGGVERSKAEYAAHHLPADAEFSRSVASEVTRRVGQAAGALAWISTEGRTTGSYKGKPLDLVTTETMVLRRSNGLWKIVHVHWSSAAK